MDYDPEYLQAQAERDAKVVRLVEQGMRVWDIAREMRLSTAGVYKAYDRGKARQGAEKKPSHSP